MRTNVLYEVNINRIARLAAFDVNSVGPVEVRLNLYVGALPLRVLPARQQIASRGGCHSVLLDLSCQGRGSGECRKKRGLAASRTVDVALYGEGILLVALPIGSE